ncbi:zinc finger (Ran-binding) family protein, partial [Klebsormidium nitens]
MAATTSLRCVTAFSSSSICSPHAPCNDGAGPVSRAWRPARICSPLAGLRLPQHPCLVSIFTGRALQRPSAPSKAAQKRRASNNAVAEVVADGTGAAPLSTEEGSGTGKEDGLLAVDLVGAEAGYEEEERGGHSADAGVGEDGVAALALEQEAINGASSTRASSEDILGNTELSGWFKEGYEEDAAGGQEAATSYDRVSLTQEGRGGASGVTLSEGSADDSAAEEEHLDRASWARGAGRFLPHPWPEWAEFLDTLVEGPHDYFSFDSFADRPVDQARDRDAEFYGDSGVVKHALMQFARDRDDIIRLPDRDALRVLVKDDCCTLERKAVNASKRVRALLQITEAAVCVQCAKKRDCQRAFAKSSEEVMFQDVLRVVQAYAGKAVRWPAASEITPEQEAAARTVIRSLVQGAQTERPKHLARPKQRLGGEPKAPKLREAPTWTPGGYADRGYGGRDRERGAPPNSEMLPGDWKCKDCAFPNFARNVVCKRCGAPGPGIDGDRAPLFRGGGYGQQRPAYGDARGGYAERGPPRPSDRWAGEREGGQAYRPRRSGSFSEEADSFGGGRRGGYEDRERRPAYGGRGRRSAEEEDDLGGYSARFDDDDGQEVSRRRGGPAPGRRAYEEWKPALGGEEEADVAGGRRNSDAEEGDVARTFVPRAQGRRPAYDDDEERGGWGADDDQVGAVRRRSASMGEATARLAAAMGEADRGAAAADTGTGGRAGAGAATEEGFTAVGEGDTAAEKGDMAGSRGATSAGTADTGGETTRTEEEGADEEGMAASAGRAMGDAGEGEASGGRGDGGEEAYGGGLDGG